MKRAPPWVTWQTRVQALKGRHNLDWRWAGFVSPFQGLGLQRSLNPGRRSRTRFALGCHVVALSAQRGNGRIPLTNIENNITNKDKGIASGRTCFKSSLKSVSLASCSKLRIPKPIRVYSCLLVVSTAWRRLSGQWSGSPFSFPPFRVFRVFRG